MNVILDVVNFAGEINDPKKKRDDVDVIDFGEPVGEFTL